MSERKLLHFGTAKRGKGALHAAGRVTLENFFSRILKEEPGGEHLPQQGGTAQQAQQTESGRLLGPVQQQPKRRRRARPEKEENTEERRNRLLQATLQRIGRMVLPQHAALIKVNLVVCLLFIITEQKQAQQGRSSCAPGLRGCTFCLLKHLD